MAEAANKAEGEAVEDWVAIVSTRTAARAHEMGLVVLSAGHGYLIERNLWTRRYVLKVRRGPARELLELVRCSVREGRDWPPKAEQIPEGGGGMGAAVSWMVVLTLAYLVQGLVPWALEWGLSSGSGIRAGEWWRPLTALCLHGDVAHWAGNTALGAVFVYFIARQTGAVWSLVLTLLAGTGGNALNAWLQGAEHRSIGASTAVFGAIAILVMLPAGYRIGRGKRRAGKWRMRATFWVPLLAGLAFLGWFGTGDARTDTVAHLTGFGVGLPLGIAAGWVRGWRRRD